MEQVKVYIFDISGVPFAKEKLTLLEEKRLNDILTGKNFLYRLRSLYAGLLLRHALKTEGVQVDGPLEITYNKFGKPYLAGNSKYFSITHSGNIVAVAVGDFELGVDAEVVQNKVYSHIAERVLSQNEFNEYSQLLGVDSILYFLKHWVVKESYLKYTGTGIQKFPFDVEVSAKTVNGAEFKRIEVNYKSYNYFLAVTADREFEITPVYVGRLNIK